MVLLDSCVWIEYFADGPLAADYEQYMATLDQVVLPPLVVAEVLRWLQRQEMDTDRIDAAH